MRSFLTVATLAAALSACSGQIISAGSNGSDGGAVSTDGGTAPGNEPCLAQGGCPPIATTCGKKDCSDASLASDTSTTVNVPGQCPGDPNGVVLDIYRSGFPCRPGSRYTVISGRPLCQDVATCGETLPADADACDPNDPIAYPCNLDLQDWSEGTCNADHTCTCSHGYFKDPMTGKCRDACTFGQDQTCNDNPMMSSLSGTCTVKNSPGNYCICNAGFTNDPATGKCRQ